MKTCFAGWTGITAACGCARPAPASAQATAESKSGGVVHGERRCLLERQGWDAPDVRSARLALEATAILALILLAPGLACEFKTQGPTACVCAENERAAGAPVSLLNVSYEPTRELYAELNSVFERQWKQRTGQDLSMKQSHGGSGQQAQAVIDGLEADVVTLALGYDVGALEENAGLIPKNWQERLPHKSAPYTSTIVLFVREGNPRNIRDWDDLVRDGIEVVTPNPKTSGGARWNYLAAWGYALQKYGNDGGRAREFVTRLFQNVPVLEAGARGAMTTFVERGIGDVLIAWENEALFATTRASPGRYEIVVPSVSILVEPPVTIVDEYAQKHGTEAEAKAYLKFLYSSDAQLVAAKHFYRPWDETAAQKSGRQFSRLPLFTVEELFGGWRNAQNMHFADGGVFDQVYRPGE